MQLATLPGGRARLNGATAPSVAEKGGTSSIFRYGTLLGPRLQKSFFCLRVRK
jgi:hypothetical protein